MRPEAAFPYVSAAEGAQPRPKSRHAQRSVTLNALPLRLLQAKLFSFAATKIGRVNSARKKNEDSRTAALIVIYQDIA